MKRNRFLLVLLAFALSVFVIACNPTVSQPEQIEPTVGASPTEPVEPTAEAPTPAEETPEVMEPTITGPLPVDATPIIGTPAVSGMEAVVEEVQVQVLESDPVQVQVVAIGYLPDGCTNLAEIYQNNESNSISVQLTTSRLIDALCTEAIVPFEQTIPLNIEGLAPGDYTVLVNGISQPFTLPG